MMSAIVTGESDVQQQLKISLLPECFVHWSLLIRGVRRKKGSVRDLLVSELSKSRSFANWEPDPKFKWLSEPNFEYNQRTM